MAIIRKNDQQHGIEVKFPARPSDNIDSWLRQQGYRYSVYKRLYYVHYTDDLWARTNEFFKDSENETGDSTQSIDTPSAQTAQIHINNPNERVTRAVLKKEFLAGKMLAAQFKWFNGMIDGYEYIKEDALVWTDKPDESIIRSIDSDYHKAYFSSKEGVITKDDYYFKYKPDIIIPPAPPKPKSASKTDFYVNMELKPEIEEYTIDKNEAGLTTHNEGDEVEVVIHDRKVCGKIVKKELSRYTTRILGHGISSEQHHVSANYKVELTNGVVMSAYEFKRADGCTDNEPLAIFVSKEKEFRLPDGIWAVIHRHINYYHSANRSAGKRKKEAYRKTDLLHAQKSKDDAFDNIALYFGWELENMEFSRKYITGEEESQQSARIEGWRELGIKPKEQIIPDDIKKEAETSGTAISSTGKTFSPADILMKKINKYAGRTAATESKILSDNELFDLWKKYAELYPNKASYPDYTNYPGVTDKETIDALYAFNAKYSDTPLTKYKAKDLNDLNRIKLEDEKELEAGRPAREAFVDKYIGSSNPPAPEKPSAFITERTTGSAMVAPLLAKHGGDPSEMLKQFTLGMRVEAEHTSNPIEQARIAFDHLFENPKYYTEAKPENWAEKELEAEADQSDLTETEIVTDEVNEMFEGATTAEVEQSAIPEFPVLRWSDIPAWVKYATPVKPLSFDREPEDKNLVKLLSPFTGSDPVRPVFSSVLFEPAHIVATDAHRLVHLQSKSKAKGNYCITNDCFKVTGKKPGSMVEDKFPAWQGIIPYSNKHVTEFDILSLKTFCEIAIRAKQVHEGVNRLFLKVNDEFKIAFNGKFVIDICTALLQLGETRAKIHCSDVSRAAIFTGAKGNDSKEVLPKSDFFLLMPMVYDGNEESVIMQYFFTYELETGIVVNSKNEAEGINPAILKENADSLLPISPEVLAVIEKITKKSALSIIERTIFVEHGIALATNLDTSIKISHVALADGFYTIENKVLLPHFVSQYMLCAVNLDPYSAPESDLFPLPVPEDTVFHHLFTFEPEMRRHIIAAGPHLAEDELRPTLCSIHFYKKNDILFLGASDANSVFIIQAEPTIDRTIDENYYLPISGQSSFVVDFMEAISHGEQIEIYANKNGVADPAQNVKLVTGPYTLFLRAAAGKTPNIHDILPRNGYTVKQVYDKKAFKDLYAKYKKGRFSLGIASPVLLFEYGESKTSLECTDITPLYPDISERAMYQGVYFAINSVSNESRIFKGIRPLHEFVSGDRIVIWVNPEKEIQYIETKYSFKDAHISRLDDAVKEPYRMIAGEPKGADERKPKFAVGEYVRYEGGDEIKENWSGIITKVVDLFNEYVYFIDAYAVVDDAVLFDSAKNNQKFEAQLSHLINTRVFHTLQEKYEQAQNRPSFLKEDKAQPVKQETTKELAETIDANGDEGDGIMRVNIYLVDATLLRKYHPEFTMGGHGYVYDYIPKDEIWIDNIYDVNHPEYFFTKIHEVYERRKMIKGYTYEQAHAMAEVHEQKQRQNPNIISKYHLEEPAPASKPESQPDNQVRRFLLLERGKSEYGNKTWHSETYDYDIKETALSSLWGIDLGWAIAQVQEYVNQHEAKYDVLGKPNALLNQQYYIVDLTGKNIVFAYYEDRKGILANELPSKWLASKRRITVLKEKPAYSTGSGTEYYAEGQSGIQPKLITLKINSPEDPKFSFNNFKDANAKFRELLAGPSFSDMEYFIEFADGETIQGFIDCEPDYCSKFKNPLSDHLKLFYGNIAKADLSKYASLLTQDQIDSAKELLEKYNLGATLIQDEPVSEQKAPEKEQYKSLIDFAEKHAGQRISVQVGSGSMTESPARADFIREEIEHMVRHNFFDWNFYYNYASSDDKRNYNNEFKKFRSELLSDFQAFYDTYITKSPDGPKGFKFNESENIKPENKYLFFQKYKNSLTSYIKKAYYDYRLSYAGEKLDWLIEAEKPQKEVMNELMGTESKQPKELIDIARKQLRAIKPFIGDMQYRHVSGALSGEESSWFVELMERLHGIISTMPQTYQTDDIPFEDKIVYLHYFDRSGGEWYIVEKDMGQSREAEAKAGLEYGKQYQAFGFAILAGDTQNAEWGYISIEEIIGFNVELDFHWEPKKFGEIKELHPEERPEPAATEGIVILWSEGLNKENIKVADLDELHRKLVMAGFTKTPEKTYIKNRVSFDGIEFRIDSSKIEGDFDWNREHVRDYLKREEPKFDASVYESPDAASGSPAKDRSDFLDNLHELDLWVVFGDREYRKFRLRNNPEFPERMVTDHGIKERMSDVTISGVPYLEAILSVRADDEKSKDEIEWAYRKNTGIKTTIQPDLPEPKQPITEPDKPALDVVEAKDEKTLLIEEIQWREKEIRNGNKLMAKITFTGDVTPTIRMHEAALIELQEKYREKYGELPVSSNIVPLGPEISKLIHYLNSDATPEQKAKVWNEGVSDKEGHVTIASRSRIVPETGGSTLWQLLIAFHGGGYEVATMGEEKKVYFTGQEVEMAIQKELKKKGLEYQTEPQAAAPEIKGISIITADYANEYEINRAIEALLDSEWNNKEKYWSAGELEFLSHYSGYGGLDKFVEKAGGKLDVKSLWEFYTPDKVIEKMWGLAFKYGYNNGPLLEPACGIGSFFNNKYVSNLVEKTGYEINKYSARIAKLLHPEVNINDGDEIKNFVQLFTAKNYTVRGKVTPKYKLVIGNPPYGTVGDICVGTGEKSYTHANNYIDYFIVRGLDLLEKDGLLVFIIGAETAAGGKPFLDQPMNKVKEMIQARGKLIDAYRLPSGVFARTEVVSDIVVFRKR